VQIFFKKRHLPFFVLLNKKSGISISSTSQHQNNSRFESNDCTPTAPRGILHACEKTDIWCCCS